jgi:hypothetical protein
MVKRKVNNVSGIRFFFFLVNSATVVAGIRGLVVAMCPQK